MNPPFPRIFADFNYSTILLPLRFQGSIRDIREQNVELHEGLHIIVYDDQCEGEAIVEKIQGEWWARVIAGKWWKYTPRKYIPTLEEAKKASDGYVVLDGEWEGICYVVYPARLILCDEKSLELLVHDLEVAVFPDDPTGEGGHVHYEHISPNQDFGDFAVGEEPGIALETLWLPTWLEEAGLRRKIQQILSGKLERLGLSLSEQTTVKVLQIEHHAKKFEEDIK